MIPVDKIKSILDSKTYKESQSVCGESIKNNAPFITISRETGAGGHTLALALIEEMSRNPNPLFRDWQIWDRELCKAVAEDPEIQVSINNLIKTEYQSDVENFLEELFIGDSPQERVIRKIFSTMRSLAFMGKVILVGRAGSCVTQDMPTGVHVRLVASLSSRLKRMKELLKTDEKYVAEVIMEQDRGRRKLVKNYFNKNITDPLVYDLVCNTDTMEMSCIAKMILVLVETRLHVYEKSETKK